MPVLGATDASQRWDSSSQPLPTTITIGFGLPGLGTTQVHAVYLAAQVHRYMVGPVRLVRRHPSQEVGTYRACLGRYCPLFLGTHPTLCPSLARHLSLGV
jgi:hypothetical protein